MAFERNCVIGTPISLAKNILRFHARETADEPVSSQKIIHRTILEREFSLNFYEKEIKQILRKSDNLLELFFDPGHGMGEVPC